MNEWTERLNEIPDLKNILAGELVTKTGLRHGSPCEPDSERGF